MTTTTNQTNQKKGENEMATKLFDATVEAVKRADHWMGGAVVVVDDESNYTAIPGAYLNDISYTASREIVIDLRNGLGATGYKGAPARTIAKFLIEDAR